VYLDIGWIPSGRRAPAPTEPAERPGAGAVERQLRDGARASSRSLTSSCRLAGRSVREAIPRSADLTLPEWLRFPRAPLRASREADPRRRSLAVSGSDKAVAQAHRARPQSKAPVKERLKTPPHKVHKS